MGDPERIRCLLPYQFSHQDQNWLDLEYQPYKKHPVGQPYLPGELPSTLAIATWNADAVGPRPAQRLLTLLDTLSLYFPMRPGRKPYDPLAIGPAIICLQEVADTAVPALLAHPWVRMYFTVIGCDPHYSWPQGARYGCVTLLSRCVPLNAAYSYAFHASGQKRRAILVDVLVQGPTGAEIVRIANAHLESLARETGTRGAQVRELSHYLHDRALVGGVLAGDLNVLSRADAENNEMAGFVDVWDGEGPDNTWWPRRSAVRAGRERDYPAARLDRIMTTGTRALEAVRKPAMHALECKPAVQRIGLGLYMPGNYREEVSDHCGLVCEIKFRPRYMPR